jgi:hypothetical protein
LLFERGICLARTVAVRLARVAALMLLLAVSACAGWWDSESDAVRRAVVAYELDERGTRVDDLIVRLSPNEFRADFGHGARMVWLVSSTLERQYREGEYFEFHDPQRSYLFIQEVRYDSQRTQATVRVVVYQGSGEPQGKDLTVDKKDAAWEVTSETAGE